MLSLIHQTDLFRPHIDPDDHWDLACVFALCKRGLMSLEGVLIDYPPNWGPAFNPDVFSVHQLSYYSGISTQVWVGSKTPYEAGVQAPLRGSDGAGVENLLTALRSSKNGCLINIVGSCRDVARAIDLEPDLFAKKCKGIYLNAGQGAPDPATWVGLEYNVAINASAYKRVLECPCPLFWFPCYYAVYEERTVRDYATWWDFEQGEVLKYLPKPLQNYFNAALANDLSSSWFSSLDGEPDQKVLNEQSAKRRNMWSTASTLLSCGLTVDLEGRIDKIETIGKNALFGLERVSISCDSGGRTRWKSSKTGRQYIFKIYHEDGYKSAMTHALHSLLCGF